METETGNVGRTLDAEPTVAIVSDTLDATDGVETPFGKRWGGDIIELNAEHLAALQAGKTLALDVQNEYVVFLKRGETGTTTVEHTP